MLRRLYDWTMAKAADPRAEWWLALLAFGLMNIVAAASGALFGRARPLIRPVAAPAVGGG